MGQGVLDPGEFGLRACGEAVLPARVVGELVVSPVAFVERRVAEHGVDGEPRERVGTQRVAGPHGERGGIAAVDVGVQGEAEGGERGKIRVGVLRVQSGRTADGPQQGAGAGGRVEDRADGSVAGPDERGHQFGEAGRGEGELTWIGGELTAEEKFEGLAGPRAGGEFDGRPQQGDGREQFVGGGRVNSPFVPGSASTVTSFRVAGGRSEACGEQAVQGEVEHLGHPRVRHGGDLQPGGGPVPDEKQGAARVHEGGDGAGRVTGQLLPDPFAERDFSQFPLVAEPLFHFGECEGRAGLGAADRLGEICVAAAPVADGGTPHSGEPGDSGRGHLCRVLRHWLSPWS
ncbi:hypothetical protein GCM10018966_086220 [Streptomyces yanii]